MPDFEIDRPLPDLLNWAKRPIPWWDPVPDWLFERLDAEILGELLMIDLDFERESLERQIGRLDAKREILKRGLGR